MTTHDDAEHLTTTVSAHSGVTSTIRTALTDWRKDSDSASRKLHEGHALGGLAAEMVLSDDPTAGSHSDVHRATELLLMRIEAGLDPACAPISRRAWGATWAASALDALIVPHVAAALSAARDQAREIVAREAVAVRRLADLLLADGDLTGRSLDHALAEVGWRSVPTSRSEAA